MDFIVFFEYVPIVHRVVNLINTWRSPGRT